MIPSADNELFDHIYDSIVDASALDRAMILLGKQLHAHANVVFAYSASGPALWNLHGFDDAIFDSYRAHYHHVDLYKDALINSGKLNSGFVFTEKTLVSAEAWRRSALVHELLLPHDLGPIIGCPIYTARSGSLVEVAFYRRPNAEPFAQGDIDLLCAIAPHLERAARLRLRLGEAASVPAWTVELLESLPWGIVLLDGIGHIVSVNGEAGRILRAADGLSLGPVGIQATHTEDARRLRYVLGHARCQGGFGGDVRIARPSGAPSYLLSIVPLSRSEPLYLSTLVPRVAVHIWDPLVRPQDDHNRLAAMFGLTPAERTVALELVQELSLAEIAERHGVARSTIKTHLLRLFAKTGTKRQSDVVAALVRCLTLPAHGR